MVFSGIVTLQRLKSTAAIGFMIVLASCQSVQLGLPGQGLFDNNSTPPPVVSNLPEARGEVIGSGKIRVALLLPLSAPGNAAKIGKQQANAAKLAMRDFGMNTIQLVIKNTSGQASAAQLVAEEARLEQSSIILGPLFSSNVSAVSAVTIPAKLPVIAFSSDSKRARRGVYLMSFSPQADINRALNYAISQGQTSFVALLPNGAYGDLAEKTMKQTLTKTGSRLVALARYGQTAKSIQTAARSVASAANSASAIYIPDGGQVPVAILAALQQSGVNTAAKMVVGSGQWESTDITKSQINGAYFSGRDKRKFSGFSTRYKAAYGEFPTSTAGLAYDAVSMVAGLARRNTGSPFAFANIENRNGYGGVNGIFRFRSDGRAERGLVVYQVQGGKASIVSDAPSTFSSGS